MMFRGRVRQLHFVGIGGVGMSGLAQLVRSLDFEVSGSDLRLSTTTEALARLGVRIDLGHAAANVHGADVVVRSSAIGADNPELLEARELGIPVIGRAELLAELMRVKVGVAVAGSHGKTTTTSLIASVLVAAGLDPTVAVGGKMAVFGSNAHLGRGDVMVAEADESDGSFLCLTPTVAVVTNIDPEHLDYWHTAERLVDGFVEFCSSVPFYGLSVLCLDDAHIASILPRLRGRRVTYGTSSEADYTARGLHSRGLSTVFNAFRRGEALGGFSIKMPGEHNVLNALAVIAVADELGVPLEVTKEALATFDGVGRRFTLVGEHAGVTLIDDYGHHPTEIRATLRAARSAFDAGEHRLIVAFQPHRYTRTQNLFEDFVTAFDDSDVLLVSDIYPGGEQPIDGVSSARLVEAIREHGHARVEHVGDKKAVAARIAELAQPGDVVIALGAGDINRCLEGVAERLSG